jgi:hypothetical protein
MSAERPVRADPGVRALPPLTAQQRAYLEGVGEQASRQGVKKALAAAGKKIRATRSAALKWFMVEQYLQLQQWMEALRWVNHFLCRFPNVRRAWLTKLQLHLTLLDGPQVPGLEMQRFTGGTAVVSGGARDRSELVRTRRTALRSADHVTQRWPQDGALALRAARIAAKLKKKKRWLRFAQTAATHLADNRAARLELLEALTAAHRLKAVLTESRRAMQKWPTDPAFLAHLARAAKALGDNPTYDRARTKQAYYAFFLDDARVRMSATTRRLVNALSARKKALWAPVLQKLARTPSYRNGALLAGAVRRCHCCQPATAAGKRCKRLVSGLVRLGEHGTRMLYLLARTKHPCWVTRRLVFQGLARGWTHLKHPDISKLVAADQHNIHFNDFLGSLAEAYYPAIGVATYEVATHGAGSAAARLAAIRTHALYFGRRAVSLLEHLSKHPTVQGHNSSPFESPPAPRTLRFAAQLCLYAVTGKKDHLADAEKTVRAGNKQNSVSTAHSALFCIPPASDPAGNNRLSTWANATDRKLKAVGQALLEGRKNRHRRYLFIRRPVDRKGILQHLEDRCRSTAETTAVKDAKTTKDAKTQPGRLLPPPRLSPAAACRIAGQSYAFSSRLTQHLVQAATLYSRGCKLGDGPACALAGIAAGTGKGRTQSQSAAAAFYKKGCRLKNSNSCANLGWQYLKGHGVAQSQPKAEKLFRQSCNAGEGLGCHHMGSMFLMAMGVKKDVRRAHRFFERSCKLRFGIDCFNLAIIHGQGMGPYPKDDRKAARYLERACQLGVHRACQLMQ